MAKRDRRTRAAAAEAEFEEAFEDLTEKEILWAIFEQQMQATHYLKSCSTAATLFVVLGVLALIGWVAAAASL
jgi:hypothetical protein